MIYKVDSSCILEQGIKVNPNVPKLQNKAKFVDLNVKSKQSVLFKNYCNYKVCLSNSRSFLNKLEYWLNIYIYLFTIPKAPPYKSQISDSENLEQSKVIFQEDFEYALSFSKSLRKSVQN
ncbi:hypothetical protein TTHERM_000769571 (macronuclear) [Tetrahymena thermophila SB210]|uniref:Uncharacterized protein n=1 Tax=Tetrahymena thermophila (strain SB210) TaxID=312017 RepID=W7XEC1_TETTS|nr:hypothetical protein TTHERM_000769571 [Tetrahymena thermophila SB210]EWS74933.1 hypothetical protein TTHERM_000769571 [Tetrahymena thermophila SB210]|eukprot:XP_012652522.1 hypothetical protein TTHERM_000769571 [Tetrahymena thermophila SB210]